MPGPRTWIDLQETTVAAEIDGGRQWILYMPKGTYQHPKAGKLVNDDASLARFLSNFKRGVRGTKPPIDLEHESGQQGAAGWIEDMELRDSGLWAQVEWTDLGRDALAAKRFRYFSPEWYANWTDPATGKKHVNVAVGGALTTSPFFHDAMGANPVLAASEGVLIAGTDDEEIDMADTERTDELVEETDDGGSQKPEAGSQKTATATADGADAGKLPALPGDGTMTGAERDALTAKIRALEDEAKATRGDLAAERAKRERAELMGTLERMRFEDRALTPAARELVAEIAMGLDGSELICASEVGKANDLTARDRFLGMVRNLGSMTYPVGERGFTARVPEGGGDPEADLDAAVMATMTAAGVGDDGKPRLTYEAALTATMDAKPELVAAVEKAQRQRTA